MLLRRDRYLIFVNYLSFIFVTLHLLNIDFGEYGIWIMGYILVSLLFVYYCFGNMFLLTRKKLMNIYPDAYIQLRYDTNVKGDKVTKLECQMCDYSDYWYELDKSMFGFTNEKMSVEYFNTHLSNINTSDALFKESELRLGVKRIRRMYEINKGDKSTYRILFSMLYIFISGLFILTLFAL
jgi:hypothetical protein